jgi:hypothetical protein
MVQNMGYLVNMARAKAEIQLKKFLKDNPDMLKNQKALEENMKHIAMPVLRFEFIMIEIAKQNRILELILKDLNEKTSS